MSGEIVAGLVGGLLALAGGFGVQVVAGSQARRERSRRLAAEFLALRRATGLEANSARGAWAAGDRSSASRRHYDALLRAEGIGAELAFLLSQEQAKAVRGALRADSALIAKTYSNAVSDPDWSQLLGEHFDDVDLLEASLDQEFRGPRWFRRSS